MNWDTLKPVISKAAPLLGTLIGGPAGATVGTLLGTALNTTPNPESINTALATDPNALLKIKELELTHQAELEKLALEQSLSEIQDVQHARELHKESNMPAIIAAMTTVLAALIGIGLFFYMPPENNRDMVNYFCGQVITIWAGAMYYWIGTSRSSAEKSKFARFKLG